MNKTLLFLLLCSAHLAIASQLPGQSLVPGGIAVIELGKSTRERPKVLYQNKRVLVAQNNATWVALVGIPLSAKPGIAQIDVTRGDSTPQPINFRINQKDYPSEYITIKKKRLVNPNNQDLARINKEKRSISAALNTWTDKADVDTDFALPVDGRLSSPFGLRRFFNKQARKPHSGVDIAAPKGTPIKAPANANVINSGRYFFNGNSVFLDHGQGLITGFFHLDEIKVTRGQHVRQGDLLGTVGETGRVTGPHLHWNVYLNNTKVDPALFVADEVANR